jgi:hypothetical protein
MHQKYNFKRKEGKERKEKKRKKDSVKSLPWL